MKSSWYIITLYKSIYENWWRLLGWPGVTLRVSGQAMYRLNDTAHHDPVAENSLSIGYNDGHWGKPYFDCKGGDIWMMTYTVPFFGYDPDGNDGNGSYYFK